MWRLFRYNGYVRVRRTESDVILTFGTQTQDSVRTRIHRIRINATFKRKTFWHRVFIVEIPYKKSEVGSIRSINRLITSCTTDVTKKSFYVWSVSLLRYYEVRYNVTYRKNLWFTIDDEYRYAFILTIYVYESDCIYKAVTLYLWQVNQSDEYNYEHNYEHDYEYSDTVLKRQFMMSTLTAADLKNLLKSRNLPTLGTKAELIRRLLDAGVPLEESQATEQASNSVYEVQSNEPGQGRAPRTSSRRQERASC